MGRNMIDEAELLREKQEKLKDIEAIDRILKMISGKNNPVRKNFFDEIKKSKPYWVEFLNEAESMVSFKIKAIHENLISKGINKYDASSCLKFVKGYCGGHQALFEVELPGSGKRATIYKCIL